MDAIAKMPTYQAYKDSGVQKIGVVPVDWSVKKIKFLTKLNADSLPENTQPTLQFEYVDIGSVSFEKGIEKTEVMTFKNSPSRARRRAKSGDVVVSSVRTYLKAIAYVDSNSENFVYSTGFAVISPGSTLYPPYLGYSVKSSSFTEQVDLVAKGMSYPAINSTELGNLYLLEPQVDQQTLIATFLDQKTAQIDEAIAIKEQQIALLKERKQIIIQKAVTQGLNPDVPMKDSGVDWIGEIPAHWQLKKIKYVAGNFMYGTSVDCNSLADGTPVLRIPNINELNFDFSDLKFAQLSKEETARYLLSKDDILIIRTNGNPALVGKSAKFTGDGDYMFASYLIRLKPLKNIDPNFLIRSLNSFSIRGALTHGARTSVGNYNLNTQTLGDCYIAVPPKEVQIEIAEYLDKQQQNIEQCLNVQKQQIEKLKEYKTTLINSAVTGKIRITPEMVA